MSEDRSGSPDDWPDNSARFGDSPQYKMLSLVKYRGFQGSVCFDGQADE
jgi:hypothetical protein